MKKTIYNTYVEIESQEQADRMKQLCIDNGLPIWDDEDAFIITPIKKTFKFQENCLEFWITSTSIGDSYKVTEQEFINLLQK